MLLFSNYFRQSPHSHLSLSVDFTQKIRKSVFKYQNIFLYLLEITVVLRDFNERD